MATWCVYHLIHVSTPHQHIPKLVIREVPDGETVTQDVVERAGYLFQEFDIPWANHVLERVDPIVSPSDLVGLIRQGEGRAVTWAELREKAEAEL